MGSTQFEGLDKIGIQRGGGAEPCHGPPEAFTVIGYDIDAQRLVALYPETKGKVGEAHERARAIIKGVRDQTRTDKNDPPPDWFVDTIGAAGIVQRIIVANLGPDKNGKPWVVTCAGRQRNIGTRVWNKKSLPADRREMLAEMRGFPNTSTINAELAALDLNSASNVFVPMRPSQMADHARMHEEAGRTLAAIAAKIGARDAEHVQQLLDLAACCDAVKRAVDAGKVALAECAYLRKLPQDEQERRIARKTAGKTRAAQNGAAPPRAKTMPAPVLASVEAAVRRSAGSVAPVTTANPSLLMAYALGLAAAQGKPPPEWAKRFHETAEEERKAAKREKMAEAAE